MSEGKKKFNVSVIAGDGIGPEVIAEARKVAEAAASTEGASFEWVEYPFGAAHYLKTNEILPESALDIGIDFDSLTDAGSMMGSGGMIVMDDRTCMVDVARYFVDFLVGESCGKCVPCREGMKKMSRILHDISEGRGQPGDVETLTEMAGAMADTALCGLGQSAPNPVLSTIEYFREEYVEHIDEKFCRSGVCQGLFAVRIDDACIGCGVCGKSCPASAIHGVAKKKFEADAATCIGCGACIQICPVGAISPIRRTKA